MFCYVPNRQYYFRVLYRQFYSHTAGGSTTLLECWHVMQAALFSRILGVFFTISLAYKILAGISSCLNFNFNSDIFRTASLHTSCWGKDRWSKKHKPWRQRRAQDFFLIEGQDRRPTGGGVLGEGAATLDPHQLRGLGRAVSSPAGFGRSPGPAGRPNFFLSLFSALRMALLTL